MTSGISIDTSKLDAALKAYIPTTAKNLDEIINQRCVNVAVRAFTLTPKADKAKIGAELGAESKTSISKKTGKSKTSWRSKPKPLAFSIINARLRRKGEPQLGGKDLAAAARRMIGARLRSVGFLKSGYILGIRSLARACKFKPPFGIFAGVSLKGVPKGEGLPATKSDWTPAAMIINKVKEVARFGTAALQQAINEEAAEIDKHVAAKLKPDIDKLNS